MTIEEKILKKQFLAFIIDDKNYAFPVLGLDSILGNPKITPVEGVPDFVKGLIQTKGQIIPIIDLRLILNKQNITHTKKTCVVVVRTLFKNTEKLIAFIVDSFFGIFDIADKDVKKLPYVEGGQNNEFIDGLAYAQENILLLLSLKKIINSEKIIVFLNQIWLYALK